jgi:hypothetical protein
MECTSQLNMSTSDVIAILALLIAGLSALYARWSWRETRKANQISLHTHKKEIYDAFFELKMHMTQKAESAELGDVSKFYYPSRNAKIYFPSKLSKDIEKYFEACFWIAHKNREYGGMSKESREECKPYILVEQELGQSIENEIIGLLKKVQG